MIDLIIDLMIDSTTDMTDKKKKETAAFAVRALKEYYPESKCALKYEGDPFRLLVMAVLSAQCTDKRVNEVSVRLFETLPDARAFAESEEGVLEELIRPVGLFNSKAANLRKACRMIVERFDNKVPENMDDLLSLPGIGRKVANLLRGDLYGKGGIVADTHCIRLSNRLGLADSKDPRKVEKQLSALIPLSEQTDFCHRLVFFGREICRARSPLCSDCILKEKCEDNNKKNKIKNEKKR